MIAYLPVSCYNNSKANRIQEYPGRLEVLDGSHIKAWEGFTQKWENLSAPFLFAGKAHQGVKQGGHMNTENMNQNADPAAGQGTGERTFSQEQVNAIVQKRLAEDREKASKELGEREQELARREFRLNSRQKLIDRGYPESIMDALNCSDEKSFDKALDIIDSLIKERTPSEAEKAEMEARMKAAASAPKFTDKSEGRPSGVDMIRQAMNL